MHPRVAVACLLVFIAVAARGDTPDVPRELVAFGPPSAEPLFAGGGGEAWDRDLRERGWILRHGGHWHLWYTGSNLDRDPVRRLGHATSGDGLNWTRSAGPLLPNRWVEDVCVAQVGRSGEENFLMVAEGEHDIAHLLASRDLASWRPCGPLDIRLASGGAIPDGPRGTPTLWVDCGRM
jgi:hypothetical protein